MKIAIENLHSHTTVEHLKQLFLPFGIVSSIVIQSVGPAGRSSCYGVVRIDYRAGLIAIAALNDLLFMNHYLQVYEMQA